MTIQLVRVINQQTLPQGLSRDGSILLDKIDRSQGNSSSPPYAQLAKQQVYVPYKNPLNPAVKGYVDLVPTDDVKLASEADGTIGGLLAAGRVAVAIVASNLVATPTVTAGNHADPLVVAGTGFLSVSPDITYAEITNAGGVKQLIPSSAFTGGAPDSQIQIRIPDSAINGTPIAGWKIRIFANSKWSNLFTLT